MQVTGWVDFPSAHLWLGALHELRCKRKRGLGFYPGYLFVVATEVGGLFLLKAFAKNCAIVSRGSSP